MDWSSIKRVSKYLPMLLPVCLMLVAFQAEYRTGYSLLIQVSNALNALPRVLPLKYCIIISLMSWRETPIVFEIMAFGSLWVSRKRLFQRLRSIFRLSDSV